MSRFQETIDAIKARKETLKAVVRYFERLDEETFKSKMQDIDRELAPLLARKESLQRDFDGADSKITEALKQIEGLDLELKNLKWQSKTYNQPMTYRESNRDKVKRLAAELMRIQAEQQSLEASSSTVDQQL